MANEKATASKAQTDATKEVETTNTTATKSRRGVGSARGTQRLKFSHEHAKQNGLFVGHLAKVEVTTIKIGEETTGLPSFNGMEIPRLALTFASNEQEINKRRYVSLSFTAVESNVNTIPGGKEEWKVNAIFDWFKHIIDVYVLKGKDITPEIEDALALPFEDFDDEGEFISLETEEVVAGWKVLFENFENLLNRGKDGESYILKSDGKPYPIWMKLLRATKNKKKNTWQNVNGGELGFPTFVGEGCIELFTQNQSPSIRLDAVKESIIPRETDKAKAPNMPNMGGSMGGVPMGDFPPMGGMGDGAFGNPNAVNNSDDDDMPF